MASDREDAAREFLKSAGWGDAIVTPLPGDASTRRYFRVALGSRKAMLMDHRSDAEAPTAHANATLRNAARSATTPSRDWPAPTPRASLRRRNSCARRASARRIFMPRIPSRALC